MKKEIKIGCLAKETGVTTRTIRYYEELGLISPSKHTKGGSRLYSEKQVHKLKLINNLKNLGYSLEKITNMLTVNNTECNFEEVIKNNFSDISKKLSKCLNTQENLVTSLSKLKNCQNCYIEPSLKNCSGCENFAQDFKLPIILKAAF